MKDEKYYSSSNIGPSQQQSSILLSLNRLTLGFRSKDLQQQYDCSVVLGIKQLSRLYFIMCIVALMAVTPTAVSSQTSENQYLLRILIAFSGIFICIGICLRFWPSLFRLFNTIGILTLLFSVFILEIEFNKEGKQTNSNGFTQINIILIFILQTYNKSFFLNFLIVFMTFLTISQVLSWEFTGYFLISFGMTVFVGYHQEYFTKAAFWIERYNQQLGEIIESVVTSSLFYIRYNKKEERLEFQRGNKRFCERFEVTDDESMRRFLKHTKVKDHHGSDDYSTSNFWNGDSSAWKNSLDGLIHKKIFDYAQEQHSPTAVVNNKSIFNRNIFTQLMNRKKLLNKHPPPSQSSQVAPPLSCTHSPDEFDHSFVKQAIKRLPKDKRIRAISQQVRIGGMHQHHISSNISALAHMLPSISQLSHQKNFFLTPTLNSVQNCDVAPLSETSKISHQLEKSQNLDFPKLQEDDLTLKQPNAIKDSESYKTFNPVLNQTNNYIQPMNISQQSGNSTVKKQKGESQVYKAKFTNSDGEKIKFLVRIMIFQMSDIFLAISIEKEDQLDKYKFMKNQFKLFQSNYEQLITQGQKRSNKELSSIKKIVPLITSLEQQLTNFSTHKTAFNLQNSFSLLSSNADQPSSLSKNFRKRKKYRNLTLPIPTDLSYKKDSEPIAEIDSDKTTQQNMPPSQPTTRASLTGGGGNSPVLIRVATITPGGGDNSSPGEKLTATIGAPGILSITNHRVSSISSRHQSSIKNIPDTLSINPLAPTLTENPPFPIIKTVSEDVTVRVNAEKKANQPLSDFPKTSVFFTDAVLGGGPSLIMKPKTDTQSRQQSTIWQQLSNNDGLSQTPKKGQIQQKLNQILFSIYSRWFTIQNNYYFLEFFRKKTQLQIASRTNLKSLIENIASMFSLEATNKKINIKIDSFDPNLTIDTDLKALRQIVFNVFLNAITFTPIGGYIAVRIEKDQKYLESIILKFRNSIPSYPLLINPLPDKEDCKFQIDAMANYFDRTGKINLGLRISQKLVRCIGPTDKLNIKSEGPDYFQIDFSVYVNLSIIQQELQEKGSPHKIEVNLDNTNNMSYNKMTSNLGCLSIQNSPLTIPDGLGRIPSRKPLIQYQIPSGLSRYIASQKPKSIADTFVNSDKSFESFIEREVYQTNVLERRALSLDRFNHLQMVTS